MTKSMTMEGDAFTSRSLRRERFEQMFGGTATDSPSTAAAPPTPPPQGADPTFADAAGDALSADSATFLRQSRQTRGE